MSHPYDIKETLDNSPKKEGSHLSEIKQLLQTAKLIIYVESDNDRKFYQKFFRKNNELYIKPGFGCGSIERIIPKIDDNKFIGIRDADFITVLGLSSHPRIFLTDTHDLETLSLKEQDVINSINSEHDVEIEINDIFEILKPLTLLAFYNYKKQLFIKFDPIISKLNKLYNNKKLDLDSLIFDLKQVQVNLKIEIDKSEVESLNSIFNEYCSFKLYNGHHICCIIAAKITESKKLDSTLKKNKKGIDEKGITEAVRLAYHPPHFKKTALYSSLKNYLSENKIPYLFNN